MFSIHGKSGPKNSWKAFSKCFAGMVGLLKPTHKITIPCQIVKWKHKSKMSTKEELTARCSGWLRIWTWVFLNHGLKGWNSLRKIGELSLSLSLSLTNLGFFIIPRVSWELLNTTTNLQMKRSEQGFTCKEQLSWNPTTKTPNSGRDCVYQFSRMGFCSGTALQIGWDGYVMMMMMMMMWIFLINNFGVCSALWWCRSCAPVLFLMASVQHTSAGITTIRLIMLISLWISCLSQSCAWPVLMIVFDQQCHLLLSILQLPDDKHLQQIHHLHHMH